MRSGCGCDIDGISLHAVVLMFSVTLSMRILTLIAPRTTVAAATLAMHYADVERSINYASGSYEAFADLSVTSGLVAKETWPLAA
jgi:hypothetical protein